MKTNCFVGGDTNDTIICIENHRFSYSWMTINMITFLDRRETTVAIRYIEKGELCQVLQWYFMINLAPD